MSAESHRISLLEPYLDRPEPAPTLLKMLVGVQLAGFREDAGLAQDQAARALGFSPAKLSRIEAGKGRRPPAENDVRALLELYGTDDYEASVLLKLLHRAGEPGWWQRYDKRLMPEWFDRLVGLQEAAAAIRTFEIQYVPGLLQTPEYTRAVVRRGLPTAPAAEVRRRVELRTRRTELLLRADAPQLWAVIDESVLLRVLGSVDVMREQLAHLVEMAQRSNVTVQIVPLDVTNASALPYRSRICASAVSICPTSSIWSTSRAPTSWRTRTRRRSTGSPWTGWPTRRSRLARRWSGCARRWNSGIPRPDSPGPVRPQGRRPTPPNSIHSWVS